MAAAPAKRWTAEEESKIRSILGSKWVDKIGVAQAIANHRAANKAESINCYKSRRAGF